MHEEPRRAPYRSSTRLLDPACQQVFKAGLASSWATGRTLSLDDSVRHALAT